MNYMKGYKGWYKEVFLKDRWYKTFLGIHQRHTYWLYKVIDEILNENDVKGIIEIGTGEGGLSVFLGLECYERKLKPLMTYDIKRFKTPRLFELLNIKFVLRDCFHKDSIQEIKEYADKPIFLMCDGKKKSKEFNAFFGLLPKGSIAGIHDWYLTTRINDIYNTVEKYQAIPLHEDEWHSPPDYIHTSFWRKEL